MKKTMFLTALLALGLGAAQASDIVGYVSKSIGAGSTSTFSLTFDRPPAGGFNGTTAGVITSVSNNAITDSGSSWSNNFSTTTNPHYVKITSGSWVGRIYRIASNNATTLNVTAPAEYPAFGAGTGINATVDSYEIVQGETLSSAFNSLSVYNGTSAANADNVLLNPTGTFLTYYKNSSSNNWTLSTGGPQQNNTRIEPWSGIIYARRAAAGSAITLLSSGVVPSVDFVGFVETAGQTFTGGAFPANATIEGLGLRNLSGWVSNSTFAGGDKLYLNQAGTWLAYSIRTPSNAWTLSTGGPSQNATNVTAGTPALISRVGVAPGSVEYKKDNPVY